MRQYQQQHYADTTGRRTLDGGRRPLSSVHVIWPQEVSSATMSTSQSIAPISHYDSIYNSVYESIYDPPIQSHFMIARPPIKPIARNGVNFKWEAFKQRLSDHQVSLKFAILILLSLSLIFLIKFTLASSMQSLDQKRSLPQASSVQDNQQQPDLLKSRLLIGEFIILSQNYSYSAAQHLLLADRIVKLMDQVFLASEVRRFYSRTEVTNIRRRPPSGIIVNCNIILAESISYAAQQFGYALYDSLARSHERLANQANYVIDKSSIRFNTVPDKDLETGAVPAGLLPASLSGFAPADQVAPSVPTTAPAVESRPAEQVEQLDQQLNSVVWSEWSQWSSCVDKNGVCDPSRLHSRLRTCVAQHTGERVDPAQCKQRFNSQDQELEVDNCSRSCGQQQAADQSHIMSDAPSVMGPHTAPSVILGNFALDKPHMSVITSMPAASPAAAAQKESPMADLFTGSSREPTSTEQSQPPASAEPTLLPLLQLDQQLSCSNCTGDEICLLLMQQKVPFCAKVKDRTDESGCGGWCKSHNQLCQPVGQNAFKCIHDSECLAEEWRCHDSACIPLSKRCDGHSNCYDSSDERDCPST